MVQKTKKIGLVYLNRKAEGLLPVKRFIESYKNFNSGVEHIFITVYKGFESEEKRLSEDIFKEIETRQLDVSDDMTDINAYLIAAKSFPDIDIFCFLNTFSEIVCNNWLLFLSDALLTENVGIAGATVSYESLLNSCRLISKVLWLMNNDFLKYDAKIYSYFKTIIDQQQPNWRLKKSFFSWLPCLSNQTAGYHQLQKYDFMFEDYWKILTAHDGVYEFLKDIPPFPNPHVRSNGFVIRRTHLVEYFGNSGVISKQESYLFESGVDGLTRKFLKNKMRAVVVNNSGNIYDVDRWLFSKTFRLEGQENLLIQDNQTRNFQKLNIDEKYIYKLMTWGASSDESPNEDFSFGIAFDKGNDLNERGID